MRRSTMTSKQLLHLVLPARDWCPLQSAGVSLVKTSAFSREKLKVWQERGLVYGLSTGVLSLKFVRSLYLSKTFRPYALADWKKSCGSSLRSGMMRNGIVFPLPPTAPRMNATAYGLLPTPTASRWSGLQSHGRNFLLGRLSPRFLEWMMGFPIGWLNLWGTPWSRKWPKPLAKRR